MSLLLKLPFELEKIIIVYLLGDKPWFRFGPRLRRVRTVHSLVDLVTLI